MKSCHSIPNGLATFYNITSISITISHPPPPMSSSSLLTRPTLVLSARRRSIQIPMAPCIYNARASSSIKSSYMTTTVHIDDPFYKYLELSCTQPFPDLAGFLPSPPLRDEIWDTIHSEARSDVDEEPFLRKFYTAAVLSHNTLESALACNLAGKLCVPDLVTAGSLRELFCGVLRDPSISQAIRADLQASRDRDPACSKMVHCFLYYKGFLACQAHRVAHRLWASGRRAVALLIQSRVSEAFAVDIHPGAQIGSGVLLDHATGVVIGETAVVGDNVSILHGVTLGGTGKDAGDRHPKIEDGVLIGAGTQILGNVTVGAGAKVGAGSVVLKAVPPRTTAVGNPARLLGGKENPVRLDKMAGLTMDHTSWSDYVI